MNTLNKEERLSTGAQMEMHSVSECYIFDPSFASSKGSGSFDGKYCGKHADGSC
jgi:hypothetical protein